METTTVTPTPAVARRTRLAVLGLSMMALGPLLMFAAGLIWGLELGAEVVILIVAIALPAIAAVLVGRFGRWAKIVGIVVAVLVGVPLFWTAFGLGSPQSFFDFVPGLLVLPGAVIAIVGCVGALLAGRREDRDATSTTAGPAPRGRAVPAIVGVVAVLAAVSAILTFTSRSTVDATEAALEVHQEDFAFGESSYTVTGGSQVAVRNGDPFLHTFTVDELGIDVALGPNDEALVEIPAEPGTYVLYCRPHTSNPDSPSEDDMATTLSVE